MRVFRVSSASAWVIAAGLLSHGIVAFTDHVLWDGWIYGRAFADPAGPEVMAKLFRDAGRPLDFFHYRLAFLLCGSHIDPFLAAKAWGVVAWIAGFVVARHVLVRPGLLDESTATRVCMVAAAAPVFGVLGDLTFWMHTTSLLCFWVGALLAIRRQPAGPAGRLGLRCTALLLLALSFNLNSLLVFFYGLIGAGMILRWSPGRWRDRCAGTLKQAARHADFLMLPVIFWVIKTHLTPNAGNYLDYNQPVFDPTRLLEGLAGCFSGFLKPTVAELATVGAWMVAAIVAAALAAWLGRRGAGCLTGDGQATVGGPGALRLIAAGGFLMGAAVFPYLVVGQQLADHDWQSRNTILTPLPLGLLACGCIMLLARQTTWALVLLVMLCAGASNRNHLRLQGFGVKQAAIIQHLQEGFSNMRPTVVQLRDHFPIAGTFAYYPPVIWSHMAAEPGSLPRTMVIEFAGLLPPEWQGRTPGVLESSDPVLPMDPEILEETIRRTTIPGSFVRVPRHGRQQVVAVWPGSHGSDGLRLGMEYLRLKYLDRGALEAFVHHAVETRSVELPPF